MPELVRVPRAWGSGGEEMVRAAGLDLPYPRGGLVEAATLDDQNRLLAVTLPGLPLVLGGCCCAHVGAARGLADVHGRIALVWCDAHGDLNTPDTSPSGNQWGMPLRMLLDDGTVRIDDVALLGARNLDPPEQEYIAARGLETSQLGLAEVLDGVAGVYIAFDCDVLDPSQMRVFMPEPDGMALEAAEALLAMVASRAAVVGMGLTGLAADPGNIPALVRLCSAAGLEPVVR